MITELNNLKDEVFKTCEETNVARIEMRAAIESFKEQECAFNREIEELHRQIQKLQNEALITNKEHDNTLALVKTNNIKEVHDLNQLHKKDIEELINKHREEINQYEVRLRELERIGIKLKEYYEAHTNIKSNDLNTYIDYVLTQIEKYENDNRWLIGQLAELGQRLTKQPLLNDVTYALLIVNCCC